MGERSAFAIARARARATARAAREASSSNARVWGRDDFSYMQSPHLATTWRRERAVGAARRGAARG